MISNKRPYFDPKQYYTILLEVGIISSLLILIAAAKLKIEPATNSDLPLVTKQEVVKMEDVINTKQEEMPPAPPRPQAPIAVPNNTVIEDEIPNINAEINYNEPLEIPDPPKQIVNKDENEDFFIAVEQMPKLMGTLADLQEKIEYPETAINANIEGRVVVQFIINTKGRVENPRVIRGIGGGCDEEAVRVTKLARFKPGRQRGKAVRVRYSLPFTFILRNK